MIYFFSILKIIIINLFYYLFKYLSYEQFIINIIKQFAELNIIFAKIFQWSFVDEKQDNKYFTDKILNFLQNYTNNSPYSNSDINYYKILQIYIESKNNNDIFEISDIKPINSGTISLVFKGKLNNRHIVIKLLRNNIELKLINALDFFNKIGLITSKLPYLNNLMIDRIIKKNKKNFYEQINFKKEVSNIKLFYNKLKNNKFCVSPNVYSYYTEKIENIIIMDFINGKKINELTKDEKDKFIIPLVKFIKNSIFFKNIFHCDLHSGNVLFIIDEIDKNYKIGIIDMGLILNLSNIDCNFCYYFFNSFLNEKFNDFIEYIFSDDAIHNIFDKFDNNKLNEFKNYLINLNKNNGLFKKCKVNHIITDCYELLNSTKKFNFYLSENINKIILGMIPMLNLLVSLNIFVDENVYFKNSFLHFNDDNLFFSDI